MYFTRLSANLLAAFFLCIFGVPLFGDDRTAADILPGTVAIYAEFPTSDSILKHPLRTRLFASEIVKEILRTPDVLKLRGGMTMVEFALGDTLENLAGRLGSGGLALALDAESGGAMLLAHSQNKRTSSEFVTKLVALARKREGENASAPQMRETEYRGFHVYEKDKIAFAAIEEWLFATNKSQLGKLALDRYLDRTAGSLAENNSFQQALAARRTPSQTQIDHAELLWSWVNLPELRAKGLTNKLAKSFSQNPAAELIVGGLLEGIEKSPYISGALSASDRFLQLRFAMPHKPEWIGASREFFFGPNGRGRAEPLIELPDSLMSLSAYRDVSAMWVRAGDLFSEEVNGKLAQADSTLATLFSGHNFGEDILGAIKPELRIVVKRQTFAGAAQRPAVQLPSFALVTELREPASMQRELKRIFQSLIGFINVSGASNGQPQLDLDFEQTKSGALVMATYVPEVDRANDREAPIQFNFSPSLAFEGDYAVLASTVELAREIAQFLATNRSRTPSSDARQHNTEITLKGGAVRDALEANRRQLVAQNILEKGHSKEQAETEIKTLLQLIELLHSARLSFDVEAELTVNVQVEVK